VWLLRSFEIEDAATRGRSEALGPNPSGAMILHPGGRIFLIITPNPGAQFATEAAREAAQRNLVAYSGRYRLEPPDRFVTTVDVSWVPGWVGSEQERTYRLDGDTLEIVAVPAGLGDEDDDGGIVATLTWVREKA
jgi:hypothetical protein